MTLAVVFVLALFGLITLLRLVVPPAGHWLRLHVFRKSPMNFTVLPLGQAVRNLEAHGWRFKMYGLAGRKFGFGFIAASPPIYVCETCDEQFTSEAKCIAHEKETGHGDG